MLKRIVRELIIVFLSLVALGLYILGPELNKPASTPAETEVLIIGAGLSGLSAAYELKKQGVPFHVLELTPRVGGRVKSVKYSLPGEPAIVVDSGMEEYWESNPAVQLIQELKLPTRSDIAVSSMKLGGQLEAIREGESSRDYLARILSKEEITALDEFKKTASGWWEKLKANRSQGGGLTPDLQKLVTVSFADWVNQGAGIKKRIPKRVADWIRVSVECEAGTEWTKFSALDGLDEFHLFLGEGEKSYRLIGGNEVFTQGIAKSVGTRNISLNRLVKRIDTSSERIRVHYQDTTNQQMGVITARSVISTIPLYRLFEVQFMPSLSDAKRDAIASQTYGSYFKAHVFFRPGAQRYWEKDSHSILPILSDSELGVIYDGAPDHTGPTQVLSLLITGARAEAFNFGQADQVRAAIAGAFDRLWAGSSSEILNMEFQRYHPRAIAGWPVGRSRFDAQSDEIRRPERGVYFAGDFTENTHSSGALISAQRVVREITAARTIRKKGAQE